MTTALLLAMANKCFCYVHIRENKYEDEIGHSKLKYKLEYKFNNKS